MAIPFAELNKINPSSVIELYELELTVGLHIPTGNPNNLDTVFRFHAGANLNNFGQIIFNGNSYQRVPVKVEGFEDTSKGTIPRPTLTFSNLGGITKDTTVMTMSDFLNVVNTVTPQNDLLNAKVTRIRTAAIFLDGAASANPNATSRNEVYFIVRKSTENRQIVEFELAQAWDLPGVKLPKRQVLPRQFPGIGAFHE